MSLKMNVETAVNIAYLDLKQIHKIGWVQYRIRLYYMLKNSQDKIPYMAFNIASTPHVYQHCENNQPLISADSNFCFSHKIPIKYLNDPIEDNTTYFFKVYLDLTLLDKISVFLNVDLLFAQNHKSKFQILNTYEGQVNQYNCLFTYLPVVFDHYDTLRICGTFHAAAMEYRFQKNQDDSNYLQKEYKDIGGYFQALTLGFRHGEIVNFYNYYRNSLEKQLYGVMERFNQMSKCLQKKDRQSKYIKLKHNRKISGILQQIYQISFQVLTQVQKTKLIEAMLQDFISIKALIYQNWNQFNSFIREHSREITNVLQQKYEDQLKERLKANIFSHRIKNHDWTFNKYNDMPKVHLEQAEIVRKKSQSEKELWDSMFPIENTKYFQHSKTSIKIFQEIYETGTISHIKQVFQSYEHIVILVHGFQAHRNDLLDLKQCIQARHKIKVYISSANIGKTEESLLNMGKRLAIEVTKYLELIKKDYKLSFIGHSMGGLIIRSALSFFGSTIIKNMHAYISICTPHLGYLYAPSRLVQAGLWLLNTWQKCDSIIELSMQDQQNLRDCLLFRLSNEPFLNKFKKISFIASSQDEYVPFESALVEKNAKILTQDLKNKIESEIICEMVENMLCEVEASEISRVDVIFNIQQKNFDSFIGRIGHIKFLSDPYFIKQFAISLDHLFL